MRPIILSKLPDPFIAASCREKMPVLIVGSPVCSYPPHFLESGRSVVIISPAGIIDSGGRTDFSSLAEEISAVISNIPFKGLVISQIRGGDVLRINKMPSGKRLPQKKMRYLKDAVSKPLVPGQHYTRRVRWRQKARGSLPCK